MHNTMQRGSQSLEEWPYMQDTGGKRRSTATCICVCFITIKTEITISTV